MALQALNAPADERNDYPVRHISSIVENGIANANLLILALKKIIESQDEKLDYRIVDSLADAINDAINAVENEVRDFAYEAIERQPAQVIAFPQEPAKPADERNNHVRNISSIVENGIANTNLLILALKEVAKSQNKKLDYQIADSLVQAIDHAINAVENEVREYADEAMKRQPAQVIVFPQESVKLEKRVPGHSKYLLDLISSNSGQKLFDADSYAADLEKARKNRRLTRLEAMYIFYSHFDQMDADIEIRFQQTIGLTRALEAAAKTPHFPAEAATIVEQLAGKVREDYDALCDAFAEFSGRDAELVYDDEPSTSEIADEISAVDRLINAER